MLAPLRKPLTPALWSCSSTPTSSETAHEGPLDSTALSTRLALAMPTSPARRQLTVASTVLFHGSLASHLNTTPPHSYRVTHPSRCHCEEEEVVRLGATLLGLRGRSSHASYSGACARLLPLGAARASLAASRPTSTSPCPARHDPAPRRRRAAAVAHVGGAASARAAAALEGGTRDVQRGGVPWQR